MKLRWLLITILLEFFPEFRDKIYVIDVPSICNEKRNSDGKPMIEVFDKVISNLKSLGFQLSEIIGFSDSSFKYYVNNKEKYFQYIKQKLIIEMPGGIKADKGILAFCLKHDNALFISQDLMREYYKYLPNNEWILERRITILLVDEEIYLIPMLNNLIQTTPKKENLNKSTLNVINIIESSNKDEIWDIYPE